MLSRVVKKKRVHSQRSRLGHAHMSLHPLMCRSSSRQFKWVQKREKSRGCKSVNVIVVQALLLPSCCLLYFSYLLLEMVFLKCARRYCRRGQGVYNLKEGLCIVVLFESEAVLFNVQVWCLLSFETHTFFYVNFSLFFST